MPRLARRANTVASPKPRPSAAPERLEGRTLMSVDVLTNHYDNARTGADLSETTLTPAAVASSAFGKLGTLPVDGQAYAQPLLRTGVDVPGYGVRDVLYVATENDSVYAFDASGYEPAQGYLWKRSFIDPAAGVVAVPDGDTGAKDIAPTVGITSTPVIDPATSTLYAVTTTKTGTGTSAVYAFQLRAMDLATGADKLGGSETVAATLPGTGYGLKSQAFNALRENQRAGLTVTNGSVYLTFASRGDINPYHGWVIGYSAANITQQTAVFCTTPNGTEGGIWQAGGGVSADAAGDLFVGVGNGTFDANTGGGDYGESAVKLAAGSLKPAGYFAPYDQQALSNNDLDFGTASDLLLPPQSGTSHVNEMVAADKNGRIYLLDRDNPGSFNATYNNDLWQDDIGGTLHNSLAYYNGRVYVGGDGVQLEAFGVGGGRLSSAPLAYSSNTFGLSGYNGQGSAPIVSADGNTGGVVWAVYNGGFGAGTPAVLYAYDATNLGKPLYASNAKAADAAGAAVKFTSAMVANGRVYVNGAASITIYGLRQSVPASPATAQVNLVPAYNQSGIVADGTRFSTTGGLDGYGYALSGTLLGSTVDWNGQSFGLGAAGTADVVRAAGQTLTLPSGRYAELSFLATATNGSQPGQTFTVEYSDGSRQSYTQSISDWCLPQQYAGESVATMAGHRDRASGSVDVRSNDVYGYTLALNASKTVVGITLPNNGNVKLLAMDLS